MDVQLILLSLLFISNPRIRMNIMILHADKLFCCCFQKLKTTSSYNPHLMILLFLEFSSSNGVCTRQMLFQFSFCLTLTFLKCTENIYYKCNSVLSHSHTNLNAPKIIFHLKHFTCAMFIIGIEFHGKWHVVHLNCFILC